MSPRQRRPPKERPPAPESILSPWRLFLAVPLSEAVTALVGGLVQDLSAEGWPVRWVAPETAHLTLHFIGETEPERAELLRLALGPVVARHAAFDLRTADLGVFPSLRRPRILWLGLHGPTHRLDSLQRELGDTLRGLGYPVEAGTFHPHVTLGRLRDIDNQPFRDLPGAIQRRFAAEADSGRASSRSPLPVPVREVLLMRSFLSRQGARHEPIARYPLRTPGDRD